MSILVNLVLIFSEYLTKDEVIVEMKMPSIATGYARREGGGGGENDLDECSLVSVNVLNGQC